MGLLFCKGATRGFRVFPVNKNYIMSNSKIKFFYGQGSSDSCLIIFNNGSRAFWSHYYQVGLGDENHHVRQWYESRSGISGAGEVTFYDTKRIIPLNVIRGEAIQESPTPRIGFNLIWSYRESEKTPLILHIEDATFFWSYYTPEEWCQVDQDLTTLEVSSTSERYCERFNPYTQGAISPEKAGYKPLGTLVHTVYNTWVDLFWDRYYSSSPVLLERPVLFSPDGRFTFGWDSQVSTRGNLLDKNLFWRGFTIEDCGISVDGYRQYKMVSTFRDETVFLVTNGEGNFHYVGVRDKDGLRNSDELNFRIASQHLKLKKVKEERARKAEALLKNLDKGGLDHIVLTFEDSLEAGNCPGGTQNFIEEYFGDGRTSATVSELRTLSDDRWKSVLAYKLTKGL